MAQASPQVSDPECAELAFLIQLAMDSLSQAPGWASQRLADWGYRYLAPVMGLDVLPDGRLGSQEVLYGLLAERGGEITLALRGTATLLEWIEDAEFEMVPHPSGGQVERGFWGVYQTLAVYGAPLKDYLGGTGASKRIAGHSLAAALGAYAAMDCRGAKARLLACPKPGSGAFGAIFDSRVGDYRVWNYSPDVVPHLPLSVMGYRDLPKARYFRPSEAQAITDDGDIRCRHSCLAYAARLDWDTYQRMGGLGASCVKGRNPPT